MTRLDTLLDALPEAARDLRLNLRTVLEESALAPARRWGVALAAAVAAREPRLREAIAEGARAEASASVLDDAVAAAAIMGMNNVFYRFRHLVGKPAYVDRPVRLRMNRLARPASTKEDFELFSLAASAINGCEVCVRSHEQVVAAMLGEEALAGGDAEVCELRKMYFLPDVRGLGLGQELLDRCLAAARTLGFRRCYLETLVAMDRARALYGRNGFSPLAAPMGATGHFGCDAWYARELGPAVTPSPAPPPRRGGPRRRRTPPGRPAGGRGAPPAGRGTGA